MTVLTGTIQLRSGTAAAWTASNPVLLAGEFAITTDLLYSGTDQPRYKIGNGTDAWLSLDYVPASGAATWGAITGNLPDQTDLNTALAAKVPTSRTVNGNALSANVDITADQIEIVGGDFGGSNIKDALENLNASKQAVDTDLSVIAGLTPSNDDFLQRKSGAWANRTVTQVKTDLGSMLLESSEVSNTVVTDNAESNAINGIRFYAFYTLPTTEKFYVCTGVEWKNGATVSGNVFCGVDLIDASPPTNDSVIAVAFGMRIAQAGTSAVQRNSSISSNPIRGGTTVGIWVSVASATATLRHQTGLTNQNMQKTVAVTNDPLNGDATAWTASTTHRYVKAYFRGYS